MSEKITYKDAGVDIDAANIATSRIRKLARTTFSENVLSDIGSFGGMFNGLFPQMSEPVLEKSPETLIVKLKGDLKFLKGCHSQAGEDLVVQLEAELKQAEEELKKARPLPARLQAATDKLAKQKAAK